MVFDGARTLLYGGKPAPEIGGNDFSDTWAYDGNAWTQIPNTGGIPRSRHTLVWDRTVNTAIVAYGTSSTVAADNVSLFVENQWRMTFSEPFNRNYHGMAYQNHTGNSVMFGGIGPTDNYTWTLTCAPSASNPVCGDLVCASNETCQTCATDCGRCPK